MRKVNRILMATIAVLLSLVLITTSVVSGIFARFVISQEATVSMNLEQFGVTLTITPDSALTAAGATVTPNITDNTAVIEANIPMAIGDAFYNAFKVQVTGKPNTDVKFIMTCHIETTGNFTVPAEVINVEDVGDTLYMPLGYTVRYLNVSNGKNEYKRENVCRPYHSHGPDKLEEIIVRNTANKLFNTTMYEEEEKANTSEIQTPYNASSGDYYLEKVYAKDNYIVNRGSSQDDGLLFYMGFNWPHSYTSGGKTYPSGDVDKVGTWLSENATSIKIRYTFRIEQIAEPKT